VQDRGRSTPGRRGARERLDDVKSRIADAEAREKESRATCSKAQADVAAAEAQVKDRQGAIDASVQERLDAAEAGPGGGEAKAGRRAAALQLSRS
jgi:multidrug resistance efflux pump